RQNLNALLPVNVISVPLTAPDNSTTPFYSAAITDQRCLGRSQWVLAVDSSMDEAEVIVKTPELIKICSKEFIVKLVQRALPGLVLTHLSPPPSAIRTRLETQYFGIRKSGPCWEHIMETKLAGIYVPGELADAKLELLVVLES